MCKRPNTHNASQHSFRIFSLLTIYHVAFLLSIIFSTKYASSRFKSSDLTGPLIRKPTTVNEFRLPDSNARIQCRLPRKGHHVITTFYPCQRDLNYRNPRVFNEMMADFLYLANAAAAIITTKKGALRVMPDADTILALINNP